MSIFITSEKDKVCKVIDICLSIKSKEAYESFMNNTINYKSNKEDELSIFRKIGKYLIEIIYKNILYLIINFLIYKFKN